MINEVTAYAYNGRLYRTQEEADAEQARNLLETKLKPLLEIEWPSKGYYSYRENPSNSVRYFIDKYRKQIKEML